MVMAKYLIALFFVFCVLFGLAVFVPASPKSKTQVHFEIPKGMSSTQVFLNLEKNKLIRSLFPHIVFFRWHSFQAGEYLLSPAMSAYTIFNTLSEGRVISYNVTFAEGMNMFDMARLLKDKNLISSEQEFLNTCQNTEFISSLLGEPLESLEGYLYPNTYKWIKGMSVQAMIKTMVDEFLKIYNTLPESSVFSRHEVVILASLVEKETGAPEERGKIASVFHNRFKKGMKFQSDPTILYGMLRKTGKMPRNIRKKDILAKTDYNTYTLKGFPKGPIANPGYHALKAVLQPEKTPYFFFVSRNNGTHVFSENIQDHEKAVDIYQRKKKRK